MHGWALEEVSSRALTELGWGYCHSKKKEQPGKGNDELNFGLADFVYLPGNLEDGGCSELHINYAFQETFLNGSKH